MVPWDAVPADHCGTVRESVVLSGWVASAVPVLGVGTVLEPGDDAAAADHGASHSCCYVLVSSSPRGPPGLPYCGCC